MAATTISRTARTDGASGTLLDNAEKVTLYNEIDALFTSAVTFGDTINAEGQGPHTFANGDAGANRIQIENTAAGTSSLAGFDMVVDSSTIVGRFDAYSSSFVETAVKKQKGLALRGLQAGGVSISAEHASGDVRLFARGTAKSATYDGDTVDLASPAAGAYALAGVLDDSVDTSQVGTDAETAEKTLHTYTLPAATLAANGQAIRIRAAFTTASNADSKTMRIKFGGTTLCAVVGTTTNNGKWLAEALVIRTGAATQKAIAGLISASQDSGAPTATTNYTTPAETLSGSVTILITGQNGTATANDLVCEMSMVEFLP